MTDKYRFIAYSLDYIHKMIGKRAENVLEMRAYIKGSSLLGIMAARCVAFIGRAKCLTGLAKFSAGQQQLKDAARLGRPATTTTKGEIEKTEI